MARLFLILLILTACAQASIDADTLPYSLRHRHSLSSGHFEFFDITYHNPQTNFDLVNIYSKSQKINQPVIIEITTDRNKNLRQHKKLYAEIKKI